MPAVVPAAGRPSWKRRGSLAGAPPPNRGPFDGSAIMSLQESPASGGEHQHHRRPRRGNRGSSMIPEALLWNEQPAWAWAQAFADGLAKHLRGRPVSRAAVLEVLADLAAAGRIQELDPADQAAFVEMIRRRVTDSRTRRALRNLAADPKLPLVLRRARDRAAAQTPHSRDAWRRAYTDHLASRARRIRVESHGAIAVAQADRGDGVERRPSAAHSRSRSRSSSNRRGSDPPEPDKPSDFERGRLGIGVAGPADHRNTAGRRAEAER